MFSTKKTLLLVVSVVAILSLFSSYSVFAQSKISKFKCGANKWKLSFAGEFQTGGNNPQPVIRPTNGSLDNILTATEQGCEFRVQVIEKAPSLYSREERIHQIFNCSNISASIPDAPDVPSWTCLAYKGFDDNFFDSSKPEYRIAEYAIGIYATKEGNENVLTPNFSGMVQMANGNTRAIFFEEGKNPTGIIRVYTKE